jgi:hypothetical protein
MITGEAVSGIIYWAGTHADPRYGCLTDICNVTRENIQTTIFFGQALIILCALLFTFALITIAVTLDKKEEEGKTFEELEKKVKET